MFGLGFWEIAAIMVVAIIVFGPDRLPDLARQAAGFVKTVRRMAENAKTELTNELGDDLKDLGLDDITNLDPRKVVRETLLGGETPTKVETSASSQPAPNSYLPEGVRAPFDEEAT